MNHCITTFVDSQASALYELLETNDDYYLHMKEKIDLAKTQRMLGALPPGAEPGNKRNSVYLMHDQIMGFMEVVKDYPEPGTAMIGLLIVRKEQHGRGIGSELLHFALDELKAVGTTSVFLSYASTNGQSRRFWGRHGFRATGDIDVFEEDGLELVAMERQL